jgi:hypothetical protein
VRSLEVEHQVEEEESAPVEAFQAERQSLGGQQNLGDLGAISQTNFTTVLGNIGM